MGRRGPPKKPTVLKLLQGVPGGKHKLGDEEPKPPKLKGAQPFEWLSEEAKEVWREIAPRLEALGLLSNIDIHKFARYCDIYAKWQKAALFTAKNGDSYAIYEKQTRAEARAGKKRRVKCFMTLPQATREIQLSAQLTKLEGEFGMSPAARSSINIKTPDADDEKTKLEARLFGK